MNAALYHRVSTVDQDVTLARRELRQAAQMMGYEVPSDMDVEETGSGARNDRPGLIRIMEAARRGKIRAVIVWKLDRFGRSALDLLANIRELEGCGVDFHAITQRIDITPDGGPMSRLLLTMLAAVAEFEREIIRERTRLGLKKARENGKHLGHPFTMDPALPGAVKLLRSRGLSWSAIAREVNQPITTVRRAFAREATQ